MGEKEVNRTTEKEQKHVDETKHPKKQKHRNLILGMMGIVIVAGVTITAKVIIPSQKYEQAETLLEKGKYMEAADAFDALKGYSDSSKQSEKARQKAKYINAEENLKNEDYEEAITAFSELGCYDDSAEKLKESYYHLAVSQMESQDYEKAVVNFELADGYDDADERNQECQYQLGIQRLAARKYTEAETLFEKLNDYKDSQTQLENCQFRKTLNDKLVSMEEGDEIFFGTYEQDNNKNNGKEEIPWKYIAKDEDKVLLLSKNALDLVAYNEKRQETNWKHCTLRKWLNETFYNEAFSDLEQNCIVSTDLTSAVRNMNNGEQKVYDVETQDNVFVLGYNDVWTYSSALSSQSMSATDYTLNKLQKEFPDMTTEKLKNLVRVWMRDSYVGESGALGWTGETNKGFSWNYVDVMAFTVRPAIWVEVNFEDPENSNSADRDDINTGNKCHFKEDGEEVCDNPCAPNSNFCSYHTQYLNEIYGNVKERYDSLTDN